MSENTNIVEDAEEAQQSYTKQITRFALETLGYMAVGIAATVGVTLASEAIVDKIKARRARKTDVTEIEQ